MPAQFSRHRTSSGRKYRTLESTQENHLPVSHLRRRSSRSQTCRARVKPGAFSGHPGDSLRASLTTTRKWFNCFRDCRARGGKLFPRARIRESARVAATVVAPVAAAAATLGKQHRSLAGKVKNLSSDDHMGIFFPQAGPPSFCPPRIGRDWGGRRGHLVVALSPAASLPTFLARCALVGCDRRAGAEPPPRFQPAVPQPGPTRRAPGSQRPWFPWKRLGRLALLPVFLPLSWSERQGRRWGSPVPAFLGRRTSYRSVLLQ